MKVAICGISGRMGKYLLTLLKNRHEYEIVYGIDIDDQQEVPVYSTIDFAQDVDLLIDFSSADFAKPIIIKALEKGIKVISGTTGFSKQDIQDMKKQSGLSHVSFVWVPNYAQGAAILYNIAEKIQNQFQSFDILESHDVKKRDRPSGTAREYADLLDVSLDTVQSIRLNDIIAAHEIIFNNLGEKIIIRHEIKCRDAFHKGFMQTLNRVKNDEYLLIVGLQDFYKFCR